MNSVILVCAATSVETKACRQGISKAENSSRFEVLQTGMGLGNARTKLSQRLDNPALPKVSQVISTGFAGSWTRQLSVGDWILGKTVELQNNPKTLSLDHLTLSSKPSFPFRHSRIISLTQASADGNIPSRPDDSPFPVVVDMESYAWAEICKSQGIPFHVVRMVSDNPDAPLPKSIGTFASIFTASTPQAKLRSAAQGFQQAVTEPIHLARFIARGTQLPSLLMHGWQEIASE